MRKTLITAAVVLLLVSTSTAAASGVIDQQQTSTGPGASGLFCPRGYEAGRHAQGVTPGASSWGEVSLLLGAVRSEDIGELVTVNIREPGSDGSPTGTILGSATAALPGVLATWTDFVFAAPVSLTPGSPVFVELELGDSAVWGVSDINPYSGGVAWVHCGADFGGVFGEFPLTEQPGYDFAFITRAPAIDDDEDGIPDEADPDTVAASALDPAAFNAPGNQTALLARLANAEELIQAWYDTGDTAARDQAIAELQNLLRRLDGCGTSPDSNDWITDCTAQLEVREAIQTIIDTLLTG
ncbi:MAG: hypothetical protein ACRDNY_07135 [Gaiellaceae bacterium]